MSGAYGPSEGKLSSVRFQRRQFSLRDGKRGETTVQTDDHLGKQPDRGLIYTLPAGEMKVHLRIEAVLVI